MYSWSSFQESLPQLQAIESTYQAYRTQLDLMELYEGMFPDRVEDAKAEAIRLKHFLLDLVDMLDEEVEFWHYPFYQGDFVELMRGLALGGKPTTMEKKRDTRARFRTFIQSLPPKEAHELPGQVSPELRSRARELMRVLSAQQKHIHAHISYN